MKPPIMEATNMPILACMWKLGSAKANDATKMDIVKPIEAKKPIPKMRRHDISCDNLPNPIFVNTHTATTMPSGFPINNPIITPMLMLLEKMLVMSISIKLTPAFAKAKIGIITKETKECIPCSRRCSGGRAFMASAFT